MQEAESSCMRATVAGKRVVHLVQGLCTQEEGVLTDQDMEGKGCHS